MEALVDLFDSPNAGMKLYIRKGVRNIIFILNPNPTHLSFQNNWSFNNNKKDAEKRRK